jgi:hypothetical protein
LLVELATPHKKLRIGLLLHKIAPKLPLEIGNHLNNGYYEWDHVAIPPKDLAVISSENPHLHYKD